MRNGAKHLQKGRSRRDAPNRSRCPRPLQLQGAHAEGPQKVCGVGVEVAARRPARNAVAVIHQHQVHGAVAAVGRAEAGAIAAIWRGGCRGPRVWAAHAAAGRELGLCRVPRAAGRQGALDGEGGAAVAAAVAVEDGLALAEGQRKGLCFCLRERGDRGVGGMRWLGQRGGDVDVGLGALRPSKREVMMKLKEHVDLSLSFFCFF